MLPSWEVTIFANGKITVRGTFELIKRKDFVSNRPLNSTITVSKQRIHLSRRGGLEITLDAFAENENYAIKAALTFLGYSIDVLSHKSGLPINLSLYPSENFQMEHQPALREITQIEFSDCFDESRLLRLTEPAFLNALSWYRKGLCSENSIDKFIGYWNSIEVLAANYHIRNLHTIKGIKNQIWSIMHQLYGNPGNWLIVNSDEEFIEKIYSLRNKIFHGSGEIGQSGFIEGIINIVPEIQFVSGRLLSDWRINVLKPEAKINQEIRNRLDPDYWFYFETSETN